MCRSLIFNRLAASIWVICFRLTSCSTRNRSRSRWLKAIRSVSIGPSATYESGHFYFAQTGHSHFAATGGHLNSCHLNLLGIGFCHLNSLTVGGTGTHVCCHTSSTTGVLRHAQIPLFCLNFSG